MRLFIYVLNLGIIVVLSVFAKDNLLSTFKHLYDPSLASYGHLVAPTGPIEVVFSPKKGASKAIIQTIEKAQKEILVSAYSFTSKDIAKALLEAKKRQVAVKIILDKSQVSQRYSSSTFFRNMGFDIRIDTKHAIFHNKIMIIDAKAVITGSYNFTQAAEHSNAENIIIFYDNPELAKIYTEDWLIHWNESVRPDAIVSKN